MVHSRILVGLVILVIFIFAWDVFWWVLGVKSLFPWHLKSGLKKNTEGFILIDVRTRAEYELFHIHGTEHRPELILHPELFKQKDSPKPIVVICMTGHRSPIVAYRLKKRVSQKVYNLTWGMLGWLLSGGEINSS
jgi:rhodanese-related sulfurtransferase